jgi:hypothetical protein
VLNALDQLDHKQAALEMTGFTVDPHQLLGLEVNPRAAAIAELVLWIGYLQWHFRTRGRVTPPEPIIKNFHNVECRDAVLAWDRTEPVLDDKSSTVTRWDGRTMKKHPVTGEEVPDETARIPVVKYINPRPTIWPEADFIVGNPPFVGDKVMRGTLGDGYVDALRLTYPSVPESSDFVLYWWHKAAELVRSGTAKRFGLITTNSLRQTFSRRIVAAHLSAEPPLTLEFAIPDHPWVDSADGAAVRIAMTVGSRISGLGTLMEVVSEQKAANGMRDVVLTTKHGLILPNLSTGAKTAATEALLANSGLSSVGIALHAEGLALSPDEAKHLLNACESEHLSSPERFIRPILNGRDVTQTPRGNYVIDLFGVTENALRDLGPIYQWVLTRVKPAREVNKRAGYREQWWLPGEPRPEMRRAVKDIRRFIVTAMVAKHRVFQFFPVGYVPDQKLVVIASDDSFVLGVLSSSIHLVWALVAGSRIGVGNDPTYSHSTCFAKFPFPTATGEQQTRIRDFAERLDAHRKRQQAQHPNLTLTDMYNVLEKLRTGTALTAKEQVTHEEGLVSVLRQLHDDLNAAVAAAYDLPVTASDEEILTFLCKMNAERIAEERSGLIRWLRPTFQHPTSTTTQTTLDTEEVKKTVTPIKTKSDGKLPWPKTLAEQAQAVRAALTAAAGPVDVTTLAKNFKGTKIDRLEDILETLVSLGQARALPDDRYVAL